MRARTLSLAILLAALHPNAAHAQSVRATGVIDGAVSDTNLVPLAGAEVSIVRTSIRVVTGENGRFRISQIPAGNYLLVARHVGSHPISRLVAVSEGDTLRISLTLETAAQSLDSVVVTGISRSPRMLEFDERRTREQGQFMTAEEIDKRNSVSATELLRTFTGVSVKMYPGGGGQMQYFATSSRGAMIFSKAVPGEDQKIFLRKQGPVLSESTINGCLMKIFVDGVAMPSPLNLDLLPSPKDLAGIEVYSGPSTTPLQFAGSESACGVILVWTKDGR